MKTLQTTQKRLYTSPFIEVLEAENDTPLLANSKVQRENLQSVPNPDPTSGTFAEDGGLGTEE